MYNENFWTTPTGDQRWTPSPDVVKLPVFVAWKRFALKTYGSQVRGAGDELLYISVGERRFVPGIYVLHPLYKVKDSAGILYSHARRMELLLLKNNRSRKYEWPVEVNKRSRARNLQFSCLLYVFRPLSVSSENSNSIHRGNSILPTFIFPPFFPFFFFFNRVERRERRIRKKLIPIRAF